MARRRRWQRLAGVALVAIGAVWLLQGLRVLPGSFMTGSLLWAVIGAVCILVGGGLLYWGSRLPG